MSIHSISPSDDRITAMGFVAGKFAKTIFILTIIGTDKNIPKTPQILPQRASDSRITKGERFSDFPINRGSRIVPIVICIEISITETIING